MRSGAAKTGGYTQMCGSWSAGGKKRPQRISQADRRPVIRCVALNCEMQNSRPLHSLVVGPRTLGTRLAVVREESLQAFGYQHTTLRHGGPQVVAERRRLAASYSQGRIWHGRAEICSWFPVWRSETTSLQDQITLVPPAGRKRRDGSELTACFLIVWPCFEIFPAN